MEIDKLRQNLTNLTGSTVAAKLRQLMPEIEEKVQQGVHHDEIVAALNAGGLDVTLEAFRKTLYRHRKQHRADKTAKPLPRPSRMDGNPSVREEGSGSGEADNEQTGASPSFDDALDRRKRDQVSEGYLTRRRQVIGKNRK